jgi:hypothetical protein
MLSRCNFFLHFFEPFDMMGICAIILFVLDDLYDMR